LSAGGAPSDGEDGVVEAGSASCVVEDTGAVELEAGLVSLNGDGERTAGEGGLHGGDVVGGDVGVTGGLNVSLGLARVGAGRNGSGS